MKSRINGFDSSLRAAVLACILVIIYVGPASALGLDNILNEDSSGSISGGQVMTWSICVWVFALPLIMTYKWWDANPPGSVAALGVFLAMILLLWIITRTFGVAIFAVALAAPFHLMSDTDVDVDTFFFSAIVLSLIICIVIPILALVFQLARREDWARLQF